MDLGRGGGLSPPICINVRNRRAENHEQMVILGTKDLWFTRSAASSEILRSPEPALSAAEGMT